MASSGDQFLLGQSMQQPQPQFRNPIASTQHNLQAQPLRPQPPQAIASAQLPPRPQQLVGQDAAKTSTSTAAAAAPPKSGAKASGKAGAPGARVAEATPARKSKKRKATDKQIMEQVAGFLPESLMYTKMLEVERRLDRCLTHKKLDIQEALQQPERMERVLRLYMFNTHINQPLNATARENVRPQQPPAWTFCMCGRLLTQLESEEAGGGLPSAAPTSAAARAADSDLKFTQLVKSVSIQLDADQYPGEEGKILWEWDKHMGDPTDGFEVKRIGSKDVNLKISITLDYTPNRYKLSDELSTLLGVTVETRPNIIAALWQYVKLNKLQSTSDVSNIVCNERLAQIFGENVNSKVKMTTLASRMLQHLSAPPPIELDYTVRVEGNPKPECYDIYVDVPSNSRVKLTGFLNRFEKNDEVNQLNSTINASIKKIQEHKKRRSFFLGFSTSPVDFVNALIASQSRDIKAMSAGDAQDMEFDRRSDFYKKPWVEDAVTRYLYRQQAAGL